MVRTTMQHPRPSTSTEKKPAKNKVRNDIVFVLCAGVVRVLHLPSLNALFRDLNAFVSGPGADINKAIRGRVKGCDSTCRRRGVVRRISQLLVTETLVPQAFVSGSSIAPETVISVNLLWVIKTKLVSTRFP